MELMTFLNSRLGPMLGLFLIRLLNQTQAYRLADWVADRVAANTKGSVAIGVRANQAVIRGLKYDDPVLDDAVRQVLRNAARGYADWYRAVAMGPERVMDGIKIQPQLENIIREELTTNRGLMIVGPHMSSFNLLLLALGIHQFPIQALSYARVEGSTHVDNAVRRNFGIHLTPISMRSLRQAIQRLRSGGVVITAIDRPDVGGEALTFFGRQAVLPVGHARLAVQTGSKILIGNVQRLHEGLYEAVCAELLEPEITGDRQSDVQRLAQKALDVMEGIIRVRPEEWLVFLPVWPEIIP